MKSEPARERTDDSAVGLQPPDCVHRGGTEDCPDVCWLLYGHRYARVLPPAEGRA